MWRLRRLGWGRRCCRQQRTKPHNPTMREALPQSSAWLGQCGSDTERRSGENRCRSRATGRLPGMVTSSARDKLAKLRSALRRLAPAMLANRRSRPIRFSPLQSGRQVGSATAPPATAAISSSTGTRRIIGRFITPLPSLRLLTPEPRSIVASWVVNHNPDYRGLHGAPAPLSDFLSENLHAARAGICVRARPCPRRELSGGPGWGSRGSLTGRRRRLPGSLSGCRRAERRRHGPPRAGLRAESHLTER